MGLLDGLLGGGDQKSKVVLPGYMETPAKRIGYGVDAVLGQVTGPNLLSREQQAALHRLYELSGRSGRDSGLGGLPADILEGVRAGAGVGEGADFLRGVLGGAEVNPAMAQASRLAAGEEVGGNPHLDAAYDRAARAVTKNFREATVPGMTAQASMAGRTGSGAYARLRNDADATLGQALGDLSTQLYGQAYESERGRQMQALGLQGQLGQQDVANRFQATGAFQQGLGTQMQAAGMVPGAINARLLDAQNLLNTANAERDLMFRPFQTANQALQGLQFGQTQVARQETNPLVQALGLAGGIAGMFCDLRLKTDLRRVGALACGAGLYAFRYRWDDPWVVRLGPIAQELALHLPEAVAVTPAGWLVVDPAKVR